MTTPDEDMAILDQLLELQQSDNAFQTTQTETQNEINKVQEELDEQEGLLLKLRASLKTYHSMKDKYEIMISEIAHLEDEKVQVSERSKLCCLLLSAIVTLIARTASPCFSFPI